MSEKTKNILFILFVMVMVTALAWLGVCERVRNRHIAENNRQLSESLSKEDSQKRSAGEKVYVELGKAIDEAGIGIVCIGDGEMAGNQQDSLPHELDKLTNDTLFTKISDDLAKKNKVYDTRDLVLDVANRGTKNEDLNAVLARCGAHRMLVEKDFAMPEGSDYVVVEMEDESGNELHFAKQENVKFGKVNIDGVEGRFYSASESYDETHPKFAFRREKAGDRAKVKAGTVIETEGATTYTGYYPVIFFGQQQDVEADEFVSGVKDILEAYGKGAAGGLGDRSGDEADNGDESSDGGGDGAGGDEDGSDSDKNGDDGGSDDGGGGYYAVICTTAEDSEYDKALREAFGDRYFRNDKRSNEMTRVDYEDLASRIYESLDKQGTFNRIKSAVETAEKSL